MFNRFEVAKGRNSRLSRALFANYVTKLYILRSKTQHIQAILFWKYPFSSSFLFLVWNWNQTCIVLG